MHGEKVDSLDYGGVKFLVSKNYYSKTEQKSSICIDVFGYENGLFYPVPYQMKNFKIMDLLLITGSSNSHYVYIIDFNRFM